MADNLPFQPDDLVYFDTAAAAQCEFLAYPADPEETEAMIFRGSQGDWAYVIRSSGIMDTLPVMCLKRIE